MIAFSTDIVVTGVGVATAAGTCCETYLANLRAQVPRTREVQIYDESAVSSLVGAVDDASLHTGLVPRQAKKFDRFTHLAFAATTAALHDARRDDVERRRETGIILGNRLGGWTYVEPMMYGLHSTGFAAINAYVATAWFPAAAQGELSIHFGLGGHSKTLSAGRISGACAIEHSIHAIISGVAPCMLAGASEAPLTPLVLNAIVDRTQEADTTNPNRQPAAPGEGAAILVLESRQAALARGEHDHPRICAFARGNELSQVIAAALAASDRELAHFDCIVVDACFRAREYPDLQKIADTHPDLEWIETAHIHGDLHGAGGASACASAALLVDGARGPAFDRHRVLCLVIDDDDQSCALVLENGASPNNQPHAMN